MKRVGDLAALGRAVRQGRSAVLFHATWCPFCRAFQPQFARILEDHPGVQAIEDVIDDEDDPAWIEHAIEIVPTVILFENGRVAERLDGEPGVGIAEVDLRALLAKTWKDA